jgi:hypothetical protein
MKQRLTCCISFCKRTRALDPFVVVLEGKDVNFAEVWICQKHWSTLPLERRRAYSTARRHLKKDGTIQNADNLQMIFEENRDLAIEIAAGI